MSEASEFTNDYKNAKKRVVVGYGVNNIPLSAFYGWALLTSSEISHSVTSMVVINSPLHGPTIDI